MSAAVNKLSVENPEDAASWAVLWPHVQALLAAAHQLPEQAEDALANAAARMSTAFLWTGSYTAALAAAQAGPDRPHSLTDDHPAILRLRRARAGARRFLGRYGAAETEFRQVLDARLRVLGPDHPSTLTTRRWLEDAAT